MSAVHCVSASSASTALHLPPAVRRVGGRHGSGLSARSGVLAVGVGVGEGVVLKRRRIFGRDAGGVGVGVVVVMPPQAEEGVIRRLGGHGGHGGHVSLDGGAARPRGLVVGATMGDAVNADAEKNDERGGNGHSGGDGGDGGGGSSKKFLTLPTVLTLSRVAAVPALLAVFYSQETWATTAGATIFVLAAVTDWLDGYLARKMGSSSEFGAFLDPVADKLMVATTLVLLCTRPPMAALAKVGPWLLPLPAIAIIGREITMSALREWAASQGGDVHKSVAVNSLGKWKTAAQMVALTLLLAGRDGGGGIALGATGISLLYISAGLALWSLAVYIKTMWKRLAK